MQQATPKRGSQGSRNLMNEVFFKYLPFWPLFIVTLMISIAAGWLYLRTAVPQYEINAAIMLKDETKGSYEGATVRSLDKLSDAKIIENELKVLESRTLMQDVVKRLHLYADFFEEGDAKILPAYSTSPIKIEASDPDNLKSAKKVEFTFDEKDSVVIIGTHKYPLNEFIETEYGFLKFIPNKAQTYKATNPLFFTLNNTVIAAQQVSGLKAITSRESTVVNLSINDADPRRGEAIINELIAAYDRSTLEEKNRLAENTVKFIQDRLNVVQAELNDINQRKQTYKATRDATNISTQGEQYLKNVNENDQKLNEVEIQLSILGEVEKYIKSKDNNSGIVPSTVGLKDGMMTKLLDELYDAEISYDKLKKTSGENNPMTLAVRDKISQLKPGLLENINNQRAILEANKLNLHASNNTYSSMLQTIPQKERDLIDIDREQAIKLGIYNFLRQRLEESSLAHQTNVPGARIVDVAQATPFPVSPNSKMIYIVAFVFGLGLPAGFITAKEMLNRKVLFRSEIEKLTSTPIIGEVIYDKSKTSLVIMEGKRTFVAEQFRRIRTSLSYLGLNSQKKKILVTSSLSGEGKSFVAANLALSLALTGKKVVLLEFDLANPSLSNKLDVDYETGASNYLWGDCEPEEVIRRSLVHDNLFFIPAGPLPDNPSELLMSDRVKELLEYLDAIFDNIVIDSAPASLLSDAYVLSPLCDATLYVVKHKYTPKLYLERLDEENSVNQLKNIGIIFNGIRSRGFTKNGYGYGYGYGYIHNNGGKKKRKREQY